MVGTREWKGSDQRKQRIVRGRPEDSCIDDPERFPGQHVVRPQIAGRTAKGGRREAVEEIGGVERRIAEMKGVRVALEYRLLNRAVAAWRQIPALGGAAGCSHRPLSAA